MRAFLKKTAQPVLALGRFLLPLRFRQHLAVWIGRQSWLPGYYWLAMMIIRDMADTDPNTYNRFIWTKHIGFSTMYEHANDFGSDNLIPTRVLLFDHMTEYLEENGINPQKDIGSVFEVGCSSGFLLRHLEDKVFTSANVFEGIDIDEQAIERGISYLDQHDSRIQITHADMEELDGVIKDRRYDLFLCAGVLRYLTKAEASGVVRSMLCHADKLVVIAGCAHPLRDNSTLDDSELQEDGTFLHNIDAMVKDVGGKIHFRRWDGDRLFDGYTVYFIFCSLSA